MESSKMTTLILYKLSLLKGIVHPKNCHTKKLSQFTYPPLVPKLHEFILLMNTTYHILKSLGNLTVVGSY